MYLCCIMYNVIYIYIITYYFISKQFDNNDWFVFSSWNPNTIVIETIAKK